MPTRVNKWSNEYVNESQAALTISPEVGDLVLLFVSVQGDGTTVSVYDNAGNDIFNDPLNQWQLLANITMGNTGLRQELWACTKLQVEVDEVVVVFSEENPSFNLIAVEYSNASVAGIGTDQDSGNSNLFFQGTAVNNSAIMVVGFNCQVVMPYVASGVYAPNGKALLSIVAGTEVATADGSGGGNFLEVQEQDTIISRNDTGFTENALIVEAGTTEVVNGITAIGVVLTGGITLAVPPGFSPIDETKLVAGAVEYAIKWDQIAQNGQFGIVRPEFFYTLQKNGDTVPEPVSPVDGYNYIRSELYYMWTLISTFSPSTGWVSQSGILFYCMWNVDQDTGDVTSLEYYHPDGNTPVTESTDGYLLVLTIAQRARGALGLTVPPGLAEVPFGDIGVEGATTQNMMQVLAENSKFAAIKAEVIYCGEFVNGEQVPTPISPEDGYVYSYSEVKFMSCWKWTTSQDAFAPPPYATANGGNADGGWSQLNELQASVSATGLVNCQVFFQNHGVIDPSQGPNGGQAYGRLVVFAFCQRVKGPSFGVPQLTNNSGDSGSTASVFVKIENPNTIAGNLVVAVQAGSSAMTISKLCIKKTLTGALAVISTTDFTIASPATGYLESSPLSYEFEVGYDYYIVLVYSGGFSYSLLEGVANSNTPLIDYISGDQSGVTTIPTLTASSTWQNIAAIIMSIVDPVLADGFAEVPFNQFAPGQPLLASNVLQVAKNIQEGCYAVEFFGPTNYVNGDTIPTPVSPADGYEYSYTELFYIWNFHDTGTSSPRLFGFGASISAVGVVATNVWHVPSGGPPTDWGNGGSEPADGSIDVIVIATRTGLNPQGGSGGASNNQTPPGDVGSLNIPTGPLTFEVNGAS